MRMIEPSDGDDGTSGSRRAVPFRLDERTRALVDAALDRVFDEPFAVETADDFERLMTQQHGTGGPGALASAGAIAAFVRSATPFAERMLRLARAGSSAAGKAPFLPARIAKYALVAIPLAMSLTGSARRGVHELQVLASFLMHRFRQDGLEPDRGLIRSLTVSIALDPDRRPQLDAGAGRLGVGLGGRWIFRSVGNDSEAAGRERARLQLAAVERLDLAEVSRQWAQRAPGSGR
jgi:hypothetical protein